MVYLHYPTLLYCIYLRTYLQMEQCIPWHTEISKHIVKGSSLYDSCILEEINLHRKSVLAASTLRACASYFAYTFIIFNEFSKIFTHVICFLSQYSNNFYKFPTLSYFYILDIASYIIFRHYYNKKNKWTKETIKSYKIRQKSNKVNR